MVSIYPFCLLWTDIESRCRYLKESTRTISRTLSLLLAGCIMGCSLGLPTSANLNTTTQEEAAPQKAEKQSAESDFEQPYFSGGKSMIT